MSLVKNIILLSYYIGEHGRYLYDGQFSIVLLNLNSTWVIMYKHKINTTQDTI